MSWSAEHPSTVTTKGRAIPITMKAMVQDRYGRPEEVLRWEDITVPTPASHEVVVQVHAAAIHVGDLVGIRGEPVIARLATGLRKPRNRVPGTDVAGTVVAVGDAVAALSKGDHVFGWCSGAFAEYVCAAEDHFVSKPADLTLEQAAAVGVSASAALQLLHDRVRPGQRVLINGASGGLGSYAVQIATARGAEVTGVCGPNNVEAVRSIGAARVVDYTRDDFTLGEQRYDFILDNVANHSLAQTRRVLTPSGVLQSNNGTSGGRWFGTMGAVLKTAIIARFTHRQAAPAIKFVRREDLIALRDLVEARAVTPLIGSTYPMHQAADALTEVAGGHARGTVVLVAGPPERPTAE